MLKIGFIGTGNMGGALARAAAKTDMDVKLLLNNRSIDKAEALAAEIGERAEVCTAEQAAAEADYLFLGVKPQMMSDMLNSIASVLAKRGDDITLVTMAAGISIEKINRIIASAANAAAADDRAEANGVPSALKDMFAKSIKNIDAAADKLKDMGISLGSQHEFPTIRIMPNTPAAVGEGMLLYACSAKVDCECEGMFLDIMAHAGRFGKLDEKLIDAGTAVSGCGPAFVYLFAEALADGGVACGLTRQAASEFAAQTLIGAARLLLESGENPGLLKDKVCSPGGSTIAGVRALEQGAFRGTVMDAVIAAYEKTKALG